MYQSVVPLTTLRAVSVSAEELGQLMHAFERSTITFRAKQSLARKSGHRLRT